MNEDERGIGLRFYIKGYKRAMALIHMDTEDIEKEFSCKWEDYTYKIELENRENISDLKEKISELNKLLGIEDKINGLTDIINVCEALLKEKENSRFENVILNNLDNINKLNSLMKRITDRLKTILPDWAYK